MTVSLVMPQSIAEELEGVARQDDETAGVLLASIAVAPNGDVRILARDIRWVPESSYKRRAFNELIISSDGYVRALADAEKDASSCIWFHTHPGRAARPEPSSHDRLVDSQIADVFRIRSGSPYYGALIFSPRDQGFAFTGHLQLDGEHPDRIERLWQVGDQCRLVRAFDSRQSPLPEIYDRNVRAFGQAIQESLADLTVGVVGCGGTGSVVAEQLVRLGVRHILLIDPDRLSGSNVTRVFGSTVADVGDAKVEVLSRHLARIAPAMHSETAQAMVTSESAARQLISCDVVFGCTDDNAGRLVLSRLATYLTTLVIDCGVLISSNEKDQVTGINGRVTILSPGHACLVCRGRVDLARAGTELLTPDERIRRVDEGYAPALNRTEPAVVAFTAMTASAAVAELLERFIGYGPVPRPGEVLLRYHDREISTNTSRPREGHYCDPTSKKQGRGATIPFLEQTWPQ